MSAVIKKRNLLPYFDMAYQGFASGDMDRDAAALRLFVDEGHTVLLAQVRFTTVSQDSYFRKMNGAKFSSLMYQMCKIAPQSTFLQ